MKIGRRITNENRTGTIWRRCKRSSSHWCTSSTKRKRNGHHFLDGGILDNVPAKEARRLGADKVISVTFPPNEQYKGYSIYSILLRTLDVMTNEIANVNLQTSDYILALNTGRTSLLGIDKLEHCYKVGYEETLKRIDEIKRKIQ